VKKAMAVRTGKNPERGRGGIDKGAGGRREEKKMREKMAKIRRGVPISTPKSGWPGTERERCQRSKNLFDKRGEEEFRKGRKRKMSCKKSRQLVPEDVGERPIGFKLGENSSRTKRPTSGRLQISGGGGKPVGINSARMRP